jgi:hypothetical protein
VSLIIKIGFAFLFAVVWVPFSKGQAAAPVLAQPPVLSRGPAIAPAPSQQTAVRPQLSTAKQASPQPVAQRAVEKPNQPEVTTIVRIYRGQGYFDASLAERLKPILAKDFAASTRTNPVATVLNALAGQNSLQPQWELPSGSGGRSGQR